MKKEHWKYLSLSFSIISTLLLVYSVVLPAVTGINMIDVSTEQKNSGLSIDDMVMNIDREGTLKVTPTNIPVTVDGIDQSQEEYTRGAYVCYDYWWGQLVGFGGETRHINGYRLGIARHGTPTESLFMGICDEDSLDYTKAKTVEVPPSALAESDKLYWMGLDFLDSPVAIFGSYKPVFFCASDDVHTDGNYWLWAIAEDNPYDGQYDFRAYDFDSDDFINFEADWDGTFLVYTEEAGGGEPPVISISINTYIQTAGLISLLGAVLSGTKYGILVGWL